MSEITDILMGPDPFYLLFSGVTGQPFLTEEGRALAYTDARYAMDHMVKYLELSGYSILPMIINNNKTQIMEDVAAAGVKEISLNEGDDGMDPVTDLIGNFVEIPAQDGFVDMDTPLTNMELNGLLNRFYQELSIRHAEKKLSDALFEKLRSSAYLVPINISACKVSGELILPFFDNSSDIPIFTDHRLLGDWLTKNGHNIEEWGTWVMEWDDLRAIMDQNPGSTFYLNTNTVDLHITRDLMDGLSLLESQFDTPQPEQDHESAFTPARREDTPAGKETAPVDDWENDDPSKDFFKRE